MEEEGEEEEVSEEEEDEEEEDLEEIELDIVEEIEMEIPWSMYGEESDLYGDNDDDTNEDTALLCTNVSKTEIIVTPISPVSNLRVHLHIQ
jgi:hypothetical protein